MKETLSILVADDHSLMREGIKSALSELRSASRVHEAGNAQQVLEVMQNNAQLDLVILDLHMPGVDDLDLLKTLCNSYPAVPLVVLSADEHPQTMQRTIEHGAAGFIPKSAARNVMASALQLVLSGGVYIPAEMIDGNRRYADASSGAGKPAPARPGFTGRQLDVLNLLGEGDSNKAIARKLGLSEHTVKIHVAAIFRILNVSNRTEAAMAFRKLDIQH